MAAVAVCDVWDGHEDDYESFAKTARRRTALRPGSLSSAKKVGLNPDDKKHVTKDYRQLLDLERSMSCASPRRTTGTPRCPSTPPPRASTSTAKSR